jgi:glyoxylase-like metal-dependent hydrolase (beta-lactamase superfamily II)
MVSSKITERAFLIDSLGLGNLGTVAVYVVKGAKKTAVIDCGYASSYENVLRGLSELGIEPSAVDYLIPTHVHLDHAGGAGHLLAHMPRAKVIAHERAVPHLVDPKRLVESATSVFGEDLIQRFGRPLAIDEERVSAVGEESHLDLGGGCSLTTIHAPGHAPHQISILFEEERLLFSADAVGILFPTFPLLIPTTPPPSLDPSLLGKTLERLGQTDPKVLLVPHYGVRRDVKSVLDTTREQTDVWISEVTKLEGMGMSVEQIVDALKREMMMTVKKNEGEIGMGEGGGRGAASHELVQQDFKPYVDIQIRISVLGIIHYLGKKRKKEKEEAAAVSFEGRSGIAKNQGTAVPGGRGVREKGRQDEGDMTTERRFTAFSMGALPSRRDP